MRQRRRVWRPKEGADLRCVRVADRRLHRSPTQLAFIWPAAAKSRHTAHLSHVDTWASTLHRAVRKRTPEAETMPREEQQRPEVKKNQTFIHFVITFICLFVKLQSNSHT